MISTCRTVIVCVSLILGSRLVAFSHAERQSEGVRDDNTGLQLIESCGAAGDFVIGEPLTHDAIIGHSLVQDPDMPWTYWSPGRAYYVSIRAEKIDMISTGIDGAFTQRYIVIGTSSFRDVLARYGQPAERPDDKRRIVRVPYFHEGLLFTFDKKNERNELTAAKVTRIALMPKRSDEKRPSTPCNPRLVQKK